MRSISLIELENLVESCKKNLVGASLQEIRVNERYIGLGFFCGEIVWLIIDLHPQVPLVMFFKERCPIIKSSKPKPIGLFLNSKGKNLRLKNVSILKEYGRVLILYLDHGMDQEEVKLPCEIEFHLIPKRVNCLVRSGRQQVSLNKPLDLRPYILEMTEKEKKEKKEVDDQFVRENSQIIEEWQNEINKAKTEGFSKGQLLDPQEAWNLQRQKNLEKKKKALNEIENKIKEDHSSLWYELGENLKSAGDLNLDSRFSKMIDFKKDFSWNLQNAFNKAKQFKNKKQGTLDRLEILRREIQELEKAQYNPQSQQKKQGRLDLLVVAQAQGRKKILGSGAIAYLGKSAADNLRILRSSKAWDYWLHLRDYPGAHAIIRRDRNQKVADSEISEVAKWLIRESLSESTILKGQKFTVLIAETRFVKPIKGDKLGRVHYHSERTFNCIY